MCADSTKPSPYAFYAFYQLYKELNENTLSKSISFKQICNTLYKDIPVDTTEKTPLFVTWEKRSSKKNDEYNLRGCIGTFAKTPILKGIERYSLISALQDRRFSSINVNELPQLRCSCNILQNFVTIYDGETRKGDISNWDIGLHGIELIFKDPRCGSTCSATFLPDVMTEQGWDKTETFMNLLVKGGIINDPMDIIDNYQDYFVQVIRYEGNKSTITYDQFIDGLKALK